MARGNSTAIATSERAAVRDLLRMAIFSDSPTATAGALKTACLALKIRFTEDTISGLARWAHGIVAPQMDVAASS